MFWELQNYLGGFGTVWKNSTILSAEIGRWPQPLNVGGHGLWDRDQWPWPLMSLATATGQKLTIFQFFQSLLNGSKNPNNSQISFLIPY